MKAMIGALLIVQTMAAGCQTVSKEAPRELKDAETAIQAAKKADVEDYMPSALEGAERKLNKAIDLIKESRQDEAIKQAGEATLIAAGATNLVSDMRSYDANSGAFLANQNAKAREAQSLHTQLSVLEAQNAELKGKNQELANRPAQVDKQIPADFRVGKVVAYFPTGSSVLNARYRSEIEQLADLLKQNASLDLKLEGYADPRGSTATNQKLAEKRLQVVAEVLRAQGVDDKRMHLVTVGATADAAEARSARQGELQLDRKVTATLTSTAH